RTATSIARNTEYSAVKPTTGCGTPSGMRSRSSSGPSSRSSRRGLCTSWVMGHLPSGDAGANPFQRRSNAVDEVAGPRAHLVEQDAAIRAGLDVELRARIALRLGDLGDEAARVVIVRAPALAVVSVVVRLHAAWH